MDMEEIHSSKRSRIGNGSAATGGGGGGHDDLAAEAASKIGQKEQHHQDEDEEDGEGRSGVGEGGGGAVAVTRFWPWHQASTASRICRVSRASGGKDRHSKVLTAKGLRDRRVRLSVSTAIQFYDLQDRLGYDQPSKAVEWLIKAAAAAISVLPSLDGPFPEPPQPRLGEEEKQRNSRLMADEDAAAAAQMAEHHYTDQQQQQHLSLSRSACSSTSETSKGSVLSLSRSEIRVKARERARERTAKEKEKEEEKEEDDSRIATAARHQSMIPSPNSHGSFTELLTGVGGHHGHGPVTVAQANPGPNFIHKQQLRHLPPSTATTTDYFSQAGLFAPGQKPQQPPSGFPTPSHFGNSSPMGMVPFNVAAAAAAAAAGDHPEMQQQFSFLPDHLFPVGAVAGGDYCLNFSISPGLAGFNRGTLQSNSPSPLPHHHPHRLSSQADGSNLPFFFGTAAPPPSAASGDQSQFPAGLDGRLQLCYGDGHRHSDLKGKGKG